MQKKRSAESLQIPIRPKDRAVEKSNTGVGKYNNLITI